jgi:hypothetical protein
MIVHGFSNNLVLKVEAESEESIREKIIGIPERSLFPNRDQMCTIGTLSIRPCDVKSIIIQPWLDVDALALAEHIDA